MMIKVGDHECMIARSRWGRIEKRRRGSKIAKAKPRRARDSALCHGYSCPVDVLKRSQSINYQSPQRLSLFIYREHASIRLSLGGTKSRSTITKFVATHWEVVDSAVSCRRIHHLRRDLFQPHNHNKEEAEIFIGMISKCKSH